MIRDYITMNKERNRRGGGEMKSKREWDRWETRTMQGGGYRRGGKGDRQGREEVEREKKVR